MPKNKMIKTTETKGSRDTTTRSQSLGHNEAIMLQWSIRVIIALNCSQKDLAEQEVMVVIGAQRLAVRNESVSCHDPI